MDQRMVLKALLQEYQPTSCKELEDKLEMLKFLSEQERCFERDLAIGHFTASGWLLNKEGTHALLMHHAKLNIWVQPGGHCDGNPHVLEVALKEASEESGISAIAALSNKIFDIDIHSIPERKGILAHRHYDIRFLLQVTGDELIQKNHEAKELRWIGLDDQLRPTEEPSVLRMFLKSKMYLMKNLLF